jgi:hypothetical protein
MIKTNKDLWLESLKLLLGIYLVFSFLLNFSGSNEAHFSFLANSFLSGKLYFIDQLSTPGDTAYFNGRYYWPLGPFPAVLLMPGQFILKLFNRAICQGYFNYLLGVFVFYLVYKVARKIRFGKEDAFCLSCAFCFSSAFIAVWILPWSSYFAGTVTAALAFLSIYEFVGRKRYWLLGTFVGLMILTRVTAALIGIFFFLDLMTSDGNLKSKIKSMIVFSAPISLAFAILILYNYLRFGDLLEQGYAMQSIHGMSLANRSFGLFSLRHLPANLFYSLFNLPSPVFYEGTRVMKLPFIKADSWGMSIFITSPYFLYLFRFKYSDTFSKIIWISIGAIALPVYLFFGTGWIQYGYRYSLDFLPLLFLLLIIKYRDRYSQLSPQFIKLISISAWFNLYLLVTFLVMK